MTEDGCPRGATTTPSVPLTSAGRTSGWSRLKASAWAATAAAPHTVTEAPGRSTPPSDRSTMSWSSTAMSPSMSPSRAAAMKASTTAHWWVTSVSGTAAPCTRRRARLASWRVAVGERPTMAAISSKGTATCREARGTQRGGGEAARLGDGDEVAQLAKVRSRHAGTSGTSSRVATHAHSPQDRIVPDNPDPCLRFPSTDLRIGLPDDVTFSVRTTPRRTWPRIAEERMRR